MEESKRCFSCKHKIYEYKVKVSFFLIFLTIGGSDHCPRSVAEIDIMRSVEEFHTDAMSKKDGELKIADVRILCKKYDISYSLLADKGYDGSNEFWRSVVQGRKPIIVQLSLHHEAQNKNIYSDCIRVENIFDRLCTIWNMLPN